MTTTTTQTPPAETTAPFTLRCNGWTIHSRQAPISLTALPADALPPDLDREACAKLLPGLRGKLATAAKLLAATKERGVLILLQGMDTSGKDAVIRALFNRMGQQAVRVCYFRSPTDEEAAHDFLWRAHKLVPARGEIVVFHRSYYEDVLAPTVHGLLTEEAVAARLAQIRSFEQLLAGSGTLLFKFFLHVSEYEQAKRLHARGKSPWTSWKLSESDWTERQYWDRYQQAYGALLGETASPEAHWRIVPSDHRWARNYLIAQTLVEVLGAYAPDWESRLRTDHAAKAKAGKTQKAGQKAGQKAKQIKRVTVGKKK